MDHAQCECASVQPGTVRVCICPTRNSADGVCPTALTQGTFFVGFCLQVFRWGGSPKRIVCLGTTKLIISIFPKTQRRIASPGIEPGPINLLITNLTLYEPFYRHRVMPVAFADQNAAE